MQNIFEEVDFLDKRCYEDYGLTPHILMENASSSMANYIKDNYSDKSTVLIVCGSGNNGADGIALARILYGDFDVSLYLLSQPKSPLAKYQLEVAQKIGVGIVDEIKSSDIVVDAIFGSGLNKELDTKTKETIDRLNMIDGVKIACDIPTAMVFKADITITMGGYKKALFEDVAKDYVGEIIVANLGLSKSVYQKESSVKLLEYHDLKLPNRKTKNSHKGSFGHLGVVSGEKSGASVISALSAINIGAGLVTLVGNNIQNQPISIMSSKTLPHNTTAIAIGMGLGYEYDGSILEVKVPKVIDADLFRDESILSILNDDNLVLTPHPKEFVAMYNMVFESKIDVETLQLNRFAYLSKISKYFPKVVFLLKGANSLIAHNEHIWVNPHGNSSLSKGGSGDVLSGIIGGLLAQGYTPIDSAINGSLIHTQIASIYKGADFALTPKKLIDLIELLV